jgi:hypothetical protein
MASNQPLGAVERERSAIVGQATLPTGRAQTAREEAAAAAEFDSRRCGTLEEEN